MKEGLDFDPDRWPEVSRLFAEAAPLDKPSRHAYLDDACGHDPVLRADVESLLEAHDNAGSFGEAPVIAPLGTEKRLAGSPHDGQHLAAQGRRAIASARKPPGPGGRLRHPMSATHRWRVPLHPPWVGEERPIVADTAAIASTRR